MIRLETTFAGQVVPLYREKRRQCLFFVGGQVSVDAPITLRYDGSANSADDKAKAEFEAKRLQEYGYKVSIVYTKQKK